MGNSFDMPRWKIALLFGAAALIGGAYGAGVFDRTVKGPLNAKIDWDGVAEPRFAKLDEAEKAWMDRSEQLDKPVKPPSAEPAKPDEPAPVSAAPAPPPEQASSEDPPPGPGVPE
ncbi:hypothetical protein H9L12_10350 [Sphingomonas rhizophila]|uniref:Uncharacterized protein n=1 Tax=Sphingomonas rhizophila TaxID=2071607 RepID=A0A7G9S9Z6_9SPHN|nr:hypothetical protein [Sphingomonas rhizophila]QNN64671.1 hypothetical protein H9L12_10350 [Sphingomonas rhizophila]